MGTSDVDAIVTLYLEGCVISSVRQFVASDSNYANYGGRSIKSVGQLNGVNLM